MNMLTTNGYEGGDSRVTEVDVLKIDVHPRCSHKTSNVITHDVANELRNTHHL